MPGPSGRSLTARQAVLASVVDSSHVSLDGTVAFALHTSAFHASRLDAAPSRKKKQLNEAELALRREETARKRKHMSEKKLEDEKVRLDALWLSLVFTKRTAPGRNYQSSAQEAISASQQTQCAGHR
jgi:hypothetical protein